MDRGILWLATGFGLGRSPILPGTIGCLMGLPLGWGLDADQFNRYSNVDGGSIGFHLHPTM